MTKTNNNERAKFQEVIIQILNNNERENEFEMDIGDYIKLDDDVFMTLVIERVADQYLSVSHHKKQNGDTLQDPQIVLDISHDPWLPVSFEQSLPPHYEQDEDGIEVDDFLGLWGRNLDKQGFTEKISGLDTVHSAD